VGDTPEARERFAAPEYHAVDGVILRDAMALSPQGRRRLDEVMHGLTATRDRPANSGCYSVHEWAMVLAGHDVRQAEEPRPARVVDTL
jgi:hypothetical protein